jgi:hypothetical protein
MKWVRIQFLRSYINKRCVNVSVMKSQFNRIMLNLSILNIVTCRGDAWLIRRVWDWMIGFIGPYTFTTRDWRQYGAIADLHTLQFTLTHALEFSVFSNRILAMDFTTVSLSLQTTHEVFLQPNSFLAIIVRLPFSKTQLNSIPLLPSSYPDRLASQNLTLHSMLLNWILPHNHFTQTPGGTPSSIVPYCFRCVCCAIA